MQDAWQKDDKTLGKDGQVYRRVKRVPAHYVHPDPVTGAPTVGNAAFRYEGDGMSVSLGELMAALEVETNDLCNWAEYSLVRFLVKDVRFLKGGVVASVDTEDKNPKRGESHGLVRTANRPPDKATWGEFRDGLRRILTVRVGKDSEWVATSSSVLPSSVQTRKVES